MLFLQFEIGEDRYLIAATDVVEVVPPARLKKIPNTPSYVAGLLNYRGEAIPVVDLCYLMTGQVCKHKLSSRIAVVTYRRSGKQKVSIGLLIEHMTETAVWDESDFSDSGVKMKENGYFGDVVIANKGTI